MRPALTWISRHRNRIIYLLTIFFLTSVVVTQASVLCPPKIAAAASLAKSDLDRSFSITILGLVDKKTLSVDTTPELPIRTTWKSGFTPLIQRLVIEPQGLLKPDSTYFIRIDVQNWYGATSSSQLTINTGGLPRIISVNPAPKKEGVLPDTEVVFETDRLFTTHDYEFLAAPDFKYQIETKDSKIFIKPKGMLTGGKNYKIYLFLKLASSELVLLYSSEFTVIPPLQLVSTRPSNGEQTVLKQSTFNFSFNKALDKQSWLKSFRITPETSGNLSWPDDKTTIFTPNLPLKTNTAYSIKISATTLKGSDGSRLDNDLAIEFKTAGPVKVLAFSPTGSTASPSSLIKVAFDQPVEYLSAQEHFSLSPTTSGGFSWEGNTLIFHPSSLSLSASYKVTIAAGIKSIGGEDSTEVFSSTFTTTSERTKVIGYSVRGRPITATYFGLGPKKILLIATMHGNEDNTGAMLSRWINYLRGNQDSIGVDRTFIIVPWANPDGHVTNQRFNAHGVDLNRNWGTDDWQSLTYLGTSSYPNGGGPFPFSEPETVALRNLITSEAPSVIITYHSAANLVIGDGISQTLGDWYASQTGYGRAASGPDDPNVCGSALGYCITGAMEDWTSSRGFVTLVVEFATGGSSEYNRNFPALKGLLTLPI